MAMSTHAVAEAVPSSLSVVLNGLFSYKNFVHAIAGACGSSIAISSFYPLDTARLRLQVDDKRESKGTKKVIAEIFKDEGIEGLYRGWFPMVQSICVSNFVYFYTHNTLKSIVYRGGNRPTAAKDILLASIAGVVNVLTTTPLWVANTRLKLQGAKIKTEGQRQLAENHYKGTLDCLQKILEREGPSALWSGTVSSLLLVCNPSIQWAVYEYLKRTIIKLAKGQPSGFIVFLMGAFAKTIATICTYPMQIIQAKKRAGAKQKGPEKSMLEIFEGMIRENGYKGLYKGMEAKLLQTVLMSALMYLSYEKIAAFVFMLMRQGK